MGTEKLSVIRLIGRCNEADGGCGRSNHPVFVFDALNVKYDLIGMSGSFKCPRCGTVGQYRSGRLAPTNIDKPEKIKDYTQELIEAKILFLEMKINDLLLQASKAREEVDNLNCVMYKSPMKE